MKKQELLALPYPTSALRHEPHLRTEGSDLLLLLEFDVQGHEPAFSLRFRKQRAFRKRSEAYCTGWHVSDVYDTLCEIKDSEWIKELQADAGPSRSGRWVLCHFMIYIDSFGCLEVVAESATLEQTSDKNAVGT